VATKTQTRAIMRKAATLYGHSIKSKQIEIKREKDKLAALRASELSMTLLLAVLIEKLNSIELGGWISSLGTDVEPRIYACLHVNADGFKNPDVVRTLDFLTGEFPEVTSKDGDYSLSRCYKFRKEKLTLDFTVYVNDDSPTCRRIEIGEETIKVKKYKIECD